MSIQGLPQSPGILLTTLWADPRLHGQYGMGKSMGGGGRKQRGALGEYEIFRRHRDGQEIRTRISSRPHLAPDGCYTGSTANVTDMTEQNHIEQELANHRRQLEGLVAERTADLAEANRSLNSANHELESFAYSVS